MKPLKTFFGVFENLYNGIFKKTEDENNSEKHNEKPLFPVGVDYEKQSNLFVANFWGSEYKREQFEPAVEYLINNGFFMKNPGIVCLDANHGYHKFIKLIEESGGRIYRNEIPDEIIDKSLEAEVNNCDVIAESETNRKYIEKIIGMANKYKYK